MRSFRIFELSIIISLAAFVSLAASERDDQVTIQSAPLIGSIVPRVPNLKSNTSLPKPHIVFRWSSEGGCSNESDFFFEIRENQDGSADWRGLLCLYGPIIERLIAQSESELPPQGNYQASGTLSPRELQEFVRGLRDAGVWSLGPEFSGTGSKQSLYLRVGNRRREVPAYQSSYENEETAETRVNGALWQGLPGRVAENLRRRAKTEPADLPLMVPGQTVDFEVWLAQGSDREEFSIHNESVPLKNLWPSDSASLFSLTW